MLKDGRVATRLPARDEEGEGGLRYVCASGEFALFESGYRFNLSLTDTL